MKWAAALAVAATVAVLFGPSDVEAQANNNREFHVQNDYPRYEATYMVDRYQHDPQALVDMTSPDDENGSTDRGAMLREYFTALTGPILLIVLGILTCLCLCCWNLFTCKKMDQGKCCTPPDSCATKQAKFWQLGCGVFLLVAVMIFAFLGLGYTSRDDEAVRSIPDIMESAADRLDFIDREIYGIELLYGNSSQARLDLVDFVNESTTQLQLATSGIPDAQDLAQQFVNDMQSALVEIDDDVLSGSGNLRSDIQSWAQDVREQRQDVQTSLDSAQDTRNDINVAILVVIVMIAICALVLILLPALKEGFRDCSVTYCCSSSVIILIMLLTFLIAGIYLVVVSLMSDVCYDPTGWIISALNVPDDVSQRSRDNNASVYYLECGHYSEAQRRDAWAFLQLQQEMEDACADLSNSTSTIADLFVDAGIAAGRPYIDNINGNNTRLCSALHSDTGLLGFNGTLHCALINSLYEEALIKVCDDILTPLALMTEFFIVIAVILCLSECLQKFARMREKEFQDEFDGYQDDNSIDGPDSPVKNPAYDDDLTPKNSPTTHAEDPPPYKM